MRVKEWQTWFRMELIRIQVEYTANGDSILMEEAKELIKPLCEFRQYIHPEKPYENERFDFNETITLTCKNLPKGHKFEGDEIEF
jgi:hypothetical protein